MKDSVTYCVTTGVSYLIYLFVGEDEEHSLSELVLGEHSHQFVSSLTNTLTIVGINDEDETLGVLEVMAPQGPANDGIRFPMFSSL